MENNVCDCGEDCGCKIPKQFELWDEYEEKVESNNLCKIGSPDCEACQ